MSTTLEKSHLTQPYPGLRPFLRTEAELFFGRADQINRMLARLEENRFLAVVGSSGSGKSSLVRAGLLPVLGKGYLLGAGTDWKFVVMRPGGDPFENLAAEFHRALTDDTDGHDPSDIAFTKATLRTSPRGFLEVVEEAGLDKGVPLLLLVDQFEEIFRFRRRHAAGGPAGEGERAVHEERNDATAFVSLLLTTAEVAAKAERPIYVVITMRSDFIGDCDVFPGLPQAISDSQFLVPRLTRRQMQEVIEKPLLLFGSKAAPDLVNQMLNDTGTDPDQLPLMQHALMRTWFAAQERWSGENEEKVLTLGDYSSVGRFSNALSQHLEEAWDSLADKRERQIAQQLFLCLSERTGEGALIRRMVKLGEVAAVANAELSEVIKVVRVFQEEGRNFIMASPPGALRAESVLDISHEALLRQWARLRSWLEEEARSAEIYRRLVETAVLYAADKASLLRGPDLQLALDWRKTEKPTAAWAQRYHGNFVQAMDFLDDSNAQAVANEAARSRSKRIWTTALATAFLVMLTATLNLALNWTDDSLEESNAVRQINDDLNLERVAKIRSLDKEVKEMLRKASKKPPKPPQKCETERSFRGFGERIKFLEILCDKNPKPLTDDQHHFLDVVELLRNGDISTAAVKIREMEDRELTRSAKELLDRIANMQSEKIRSERQGLVKILDLMAKKKYVGGNVKFPDATPHEHPVHQSIMSKLVTEKLLEHDEAKLLKTYVKVEYKDDELDLRKYDLLEIVLPEVGLVEPQSHKYTEVSWVYQRMEEIARSPVSGLAWLKSYLEDKGKEYKDLKWAFLALLSWTLWWLRRWWQRSRDQPILPKPNALRRAIASLIDFGIGFGIFFLMGQLTYNTFGKGIVPFVAASLSALSYLLFCDAIRFKHCRSLGKILFSLRPVRNVADDRRAIGLLASAKRNATFIIGTVVTFIGVIILVDEIKIFGRLDIIYVISISFFIVLAVLWLSIVFMKGRTLGDRWSCTQVIDADSEESRRIDAPPRYIRPDPGQAQLLAPRMN